MKTKDPATKSRLESADSATLSDAKERVRFLAAIDSGLVDVKAGRVVPHEDVKDCLKQWLS